MRILRDVAYYEGKDADPVRHKLDLFLPRHEKNFPVLVLFHGGTWMYGDKSALGLYSAVGEFLAGQGIAAVLPNYRLSPWVKHPEHAHDAARAVAWTYRHIARYGGNPQALFVGGHSAGGHLAALLATDETYLRAEKVPRRTIRGVIALSGVYRIPDHVSLDLGSFGGASSGKLTLGFDLFDLVFGNDPKVRADASPINHVGPGLPPFLLINADRDLPLLPEMAADLARALRENKCVVDKVTIKDRWHSTVMFDATSRDDPAAKAMLEFIARHRNDAPASK